MSLGCEPCRMATVCVCVCARVPTTEINVALTKREDNGSPSSRTRSSLLAAVWIPLAASRLLCSVSAAPPPVCHLLIPLSALIACRSLCLISPLVSRRCELLQIVFLLFFFSRCNSRLLFHLFHPAIYLFLRFESSERSRPLCARATKIHMLA